MKLANLAPFIIVCALSLGSGCGADSSIAPPVDADPLAPDANPLAPDARPGTPDARISSASDAVGPDAPPTQTLATCLHSCNQPSDCVVAGSTLFDADNWGCKSGVCDYLGCNNDSECQSAYMNQAYTCTTTPGSNGYKSCVHTCGSPSDCAIAGATLYDASHWSCTSGTCSYLGCQTTSECQATYMNQAYACAAVAGDNGIPGCQHTCGSANDCVIAGSTLYDADNWSCKGGFCMWDGCNSDAECMSALNSSAYVCRAE